MQENPVLTILLVNKKSPRFEDFFLNLAII